MIVDGDKVDIGTPILTNVKVTGKVLAQSRAKKLIVFKYKSKTRQRTKNTHRQPFSEVEIIDIKK
jgi:large subunit ribosomal protein L21